MNWAKLHNVLEFEDHGEGNERRLTVRKTLPNGRARCVAIRISGDVLSTAEAERKAYQSYIAVEDPDMPF